MLLRLFLVDFSTRRSASETWNQLGQARLHSALASRHGVRTIQLQMRLACCSARGVSTDSGIYRKPSTKAHCSLAGPYGCRTNAAHSHPHFERFVQAKPIKLKLQGLAADDRCPERRPTEVVHICSRNDDANSTRLVSKIFASSASALMP